MPASIALLLNDRPVQTLMPPGAVLLDLIRREQSLTGTKEACREGDCGACLVLLGTWREGRVAYQPVNSCLLPLGAAAGGHVVTIEGINTDRLNPIQQALVDNGAIQCGFCTPGIVMALTAFFLQAADSDRAEMLDAAAGNLCRCTGYAGIKRAIAQLYAQFDLRLSAPERRLQDAVHWRIVPEYFLMIAPRLAALPVSCAANTDGVPVAGGTDLLVQRAHELQTRPLRFIGADQELRGIRRDGTRCIVGAAVTIEELRQSALLQELLPALRKDLKLLCSAPVRQHATLGGNLANASPIGDLSVLFLALDAQLHLASPGGQRSMPLREFFTGYKSTALQPGELLQKVAFACLENTLCSFEKVAKRTHLDIASVNSALSLTHAGGRISAAHLAVGGVAPVPLYLGSASEFLRGKTLTAHTVREAAALAQSEIAPISDMRGSVEYKRLLLRQLLYAHFLKLFPQDIRWEDLHGAD